MAALPENPDSVPAPTWGLTVAVCLTLGHLIPFWTECADTYAHSKKKIFKNACI